MQPTILRWDHACGHFTISKNRTSASIESLNGDDSKRPEHRCRRGGSSPVSVADHRKMHRPSANVLVVQAGPVSSQPSFQSGIEAG